MTYMEKLRVFYDQNGIGHDKFHCQFKEEDKTEDTCRGGESHVGQHYGDPFRLVVLSLDSGEEIAHRMEKRSKQVEQAWSCPKNLHMKGTLETLTVLFRGRLAENENPLTHFALVNSAKCSTGQKGASKAPAQFYANCRFFVRQEIALLEPDLLITQGVEARNVVLEKCSCMPEQIEEYLQGSGLAPDSPIKTTVRAILKKTMRTFSISDREIPTSILIHPSDRGGRWHNYEIHFLPVVADFAWFLLGYDR